MSCSVHLKYQKYSLRKTRFWTASSKPCLIKSKLPRFISFVSASFYLWRKRIIKFCLGLTSESTSYVIDFCQWGWKNIDDNGRYNMQFIYQTHSSCGIYCWNSNWTPFMDGIFYDTGIQQCQWRIKVPLNSIWTVNIYCWFFSTVYTANHRGAAWNQGEVNGYGGSICLQAHH